MKPFVLKLVAAAVAAASISPAVQAAPWQPINQRQSHLYTRIDQGVRHGDLTRAEARRLRSRYFALARLEQRYRRSGHGLSWAERADLNRRFDRLSRSIKVQRHDWQHRPRR